MSLSKISKLKWDLRLLLMVVHILLFMFIDSQKKSTLSENLRPYDRTSIIYIAGK